MTESPSTLLNAAEELTRRAGDVALALFRDRPRVETKADGSPVTIADRNAERAAREWIASRFPDDGIVGEELGATRGRSSRRWIIDPIDGTKSFVTGVPLWGTLIAVCEGERVLAGAVYCAAAGEMLVAAEGEGCWLNGSRTQVSAVKTIAEATVLSTGLKFERRPARQPGWERLVASGRIARTWGDCYGYLLVATGRAEVMADSIVAEWDTAAVQRCVVEAGGVFTDWEGAPTAFGGSAIATNALVADEARRLLR
jgi:histidinol phosphatase-like enzyme (inositol monophosphatase family)